MKHSQSLLMQSTKHSIVMAFFSYHKSWAKWPKQQRHKLPIKQSDKHQRGFNHLQLHKSTALLNTISSNTKNRDKNLVSKCWSLHYRWINKVLPSCISWITEENNCCVWLIIIFEAILEKPCLITKPNQINVPVQIADKISSNLQSHHSSYFQRPYLTFLIHTRDKRKDHIAFRRKKEARKAKLYPIYLKMNCRNKWFLFITRATHCQYVSRKQPQQLLNVVTAN